MGFLLKFMLSQFDLKPKGYQNNYFPDFFALLFQKKRKVIQAALHALNCFEVFFHLHSHAHAHTGTVCVSVPGLSGQAASTPLQLPHPLLPSEVGVP